MVGARAEAAQGPTWASLGTSRPLAVTRSTPLTGQTLAVAPGEPGRLAYCAPDTIQLTRDGGETWESIPTAPVTALAEAAGYPLLGADGAVPACTSLLLDPADPLALYAVFAAGKAEFGAPPIVFTGYRTTDGGQTWQPVPVPDGGGIEQFGGFQANGAAVQALFARADGEPGPLVLETRDGGRNWATVPLDCPSAGPCLRWGPAPNLIGSCSMNERIQPVLTSADDGQAWARADLGRSGGVNGCVRNELAALSDSDALLLSDDGLLLDDTLARLTRDGGQTWQSVSLPPLPGMERQIVHGLTLLPDGSLLARTQAADGWSVLAPGATAWCTVPAANLGASWASADSLVLAGDRLWWLEAADASGRISEPRLMSAPLAGVQCNQGLPDGFTSLTLTYCDAEGEAAVTLSNVGLDPATNASVISVRRMRGDTDATGTGMVRRLQQGVFLIAFALPDAGGGARFYQGRLILGVDSWSAHGQHRSLSDPADKAAWRMTAVFPARPLGCSMPDEDARGAE
jgi:photosystem II stability/assembly factor-like uncharacterized protein